MTALKRKVNREELRDCVDAKMDLEEGHKIIKVLERKAERDSLEDGLSTLQAQVKANWAAA